MTTRRCWTRLLLFPAAFLLAVALLPLPPAGPAHAAEAQGWKIEYHALVDSLPRMSSTEKLAALEEAMGKLRYSSQAIISLLDKPSLKKRTSLAQKFAVTNLRLVDSALQLERKLFPQGAPLSESAMTHIAKGLQQVRDQAEKQAASLAARHQKLDEQQRRACGATDIPKAEKAAAQAQSIIDEISYQVAGVAELRRRGRELAEPYLFSDKQIKEFEARARQIHRAWRKNQKEFIAVFGDRNKALAYFNPICQKAIALNRIYLESATRANKIVAAGHATASISLDNILNEVAREEAFKSKEEAVYWAFVIKNKDLFVKARTLYSSSSCDDDDDDFQEYYQHWPTKQSPRTINNLKPTADILNALVLLDSMNLAAVNSLQKAMAKAERVQSCLAALRQKHHSALAKLNCPAHAEPFWPAGAEQPGCRCQKGWVFNTDKSACLPRGYCKEMIRRYQDGLKSGDRKKAQAALNQLREKKCPNLASLDAQRTVPNVIRLSRYEAVAVLRKAGLGYAVASAGQATERENARKVLRQDPKPGDRVDASTVVRLFVFDAWNQAKAKVKADRLCAQKYPGAQAQWNPAESKFGCGCPKPTTWNQNKTACVISKATAAEHCQRNYPGTNPRWNEKTQRWDCYCPDGMVWNKQRKACVANRAKYQTMCTQKYPGSSAVWDKKSGAYRCTCANGRRWNRDKTRCLISQAEANAACSRQIANTVARFIEEKELYECFCAGDRFWQPKLKQCSQSKAEAQQNCSRKYSGSEARYSQEHGAYRCFCPDGYAWNKNRTGCVQTAQSAQSYCSRHYPGTNARWVQKIGEYRCFCPGDGKWDPRSKSCQRPRVTANQALAKACPP